MKEQPLPSTSDAVHVHETASAEKQYVLHPENNDLFVRSGKQIIESCQLGISLELWFHELHAMFDHLAGWARGRKEEIGAVIASPRGSRTGIFVIPISKQFNFDLADQMVDLEMELAPKYNVGVIEVLQIPASEVFRFLLTDQHFLIYGNLPSTPSAVAS